MSPARVSERSEWRLVLGGGEAGATIAPVRGAVNMAVDAMLLETVQRTGRPAVRFYAWAPACLSLGRNQPARGIYDPCRAVAAGVDIVRRPTGGRAVLHDHELTYSVLAPLSLFGGPRAAYAAINRAIVEGLRVLGVAAAQAVPVGAAPIRPTVRTSVEPCFDVPAAGEVVAGGRKLVGSAQRCERGSLLQHGSILVAGSQARVRDLLVDPVAAGTGAYDMVGDATVSGVRQRTASMQDATGGSITLSDLMGTAPELGRVAAAMRDGFEQSFGIRLTLEPASNAESTRTEQLSAAFDDGDWTWRR